MLIAQSQTALVQGQPQTLLVAQAAAQQPGTKTIIILQPQSQGNSNSQQQQQKMVVTSQGIVDEGDNAPVCSSDPFVYSEIVRLQDHKWL